MPDLLIELFSEEIPARMQARAAEDLKSLVTNGLVEAGLTYSGAAAFATPRRLALSVEGLSAASKPVREERKGPATTAPDQAVEGFLRSTGLTRDQLEVREAGKGQAYFAVIEKPGRAAAEIIAEVLEHTIRNFPWPKSMRWGAGSLRWVRPLHSIICLLTDEGGATVVPLEIDGIAAGNTTCGHRFLSKGDIKVSGFEDYEAKLKKAHVILRADERAETIWHDATNQAFANGLEVVEDKGLLAEVAGLVEWPVVLSGKIGEAFLGLPPEVLQTSMKEHQKFFSVRNPRSGRIEGFVTVANTETADHGATILKGNQKVLSARLSDARFFYENDLRVAKAGMGEWLDGLANVTFHNKLGSQRDRINRIAALAREIAPKVGADAAQAEEAAGIAKADLRSAMVGEFPELQGVMGRYYALAAGRAPEVADAARDHYSPLGPSDDVPTAPVSVAVALADKLDTLTGFWAIDEKPTGSKDPFALRRAALGLIRLVLGNELRLSLRSSFEAAYLALVIVLGQRDAHHFTKLITYADPQEGERLATVWATPPYSLLLGRGDWKEEVLDAIFVKLQGLESEIFDEDAEKYRFASDALEELKDRAQLLDTMAGATIFVEADGGHWLGSIAGLNSYDEAWRPAASIVSHDLLSFFHDRLKVFLRDEGIRHDVIDACLAMPGSDDLTLLVKRARALSGFMGTEDGENLIQGYKRANNILTQAEEKDGVEYSFGADAKFAEGDEEKALFAALDKAEAEIAPAMKAEDFGAAMAAMAALRAPIDAFFTAVQVNSDNQVVRRNRLNLLSRIRSICLSVADLNRIEG